MTIGASSRGFGQNGQITFSYAGTAPVITSPVTGSELPGGTVGQAYSTTITATGVPTPTFTATGLPPGLSIDVGSGKISGTPTTAGSYSPEVTATSPAGSTTADYTLQVAQQPTTTTVTVPSSPAAGSAITLSATVSPAPASGTVSFSLGGSAIAACTMQPVDPATGDATCDTNAPDKAGSYPATAAYSGGGNFAPSHGSATLTVTSEKEQADLAVRLIGPRYLESGHRALITVIVHNRGPDRALEVTTGLHVPRALIIANAARGTVRNEVDTFRAPILDAGRSLIYLVTLTVRDHVGREVQLRAVTRSRTADPDQANNIATHTIKIIRAGHRKPW